MAVVKRFLELVKRGKLGLNKGLPTGLDQLDNYVYGIQKKYMYVIGGDQGSGKTANALFVFVYQPLKQLLKTENCKIIYFSLEMSSEILLAKLLSLHLWYEYGIQMSYAEMLSFQKPIDDKRLEYVRKGKDWLLEVEKHLVIYDKPCNAYQMKDFLHSEMCKDGEFVEVGENSIVYEPTYPDRYTLVILDHLRLISAQDKKKEMDSAVEHLIYYRNVCGITPVIVQQLNRNFKAMDRRNSGYSLPGLDDFDTTSSATQAAEVVLAVYHPLREKLKTCGGYDITKLKDKARILCLLKNRYGISDVNFGLNFFGKIGFWRQLPPAEEIGDYSKWITLEK